MIAAHPNLPPRGRLGFRPLYRVGGHCPSCDKGNWHIGRSSAECAHCGTVLPLAPAAVELDPQ